MKALDRQEGGGHYKDLAIQPVEFCHKNGLGFCESSVIKYVTRWRNKNGIQDLKKAKHFIDLLIEMESPGESDKAKMEAEVEMAKMRAQTAFIGKDREALVASGEPWVTPNGDTVKGDPNERHWWLDHGEWLCSSCGAKEGNPHRVGCTYWAKFNGETSA